MMVTPKISIIIPVYNASAFLAEALDSVLTQTLTSIEVVCVDDGSTDSSGDILATYCMRDRRIRVISQTNAGASVARNRGLDAALGEYVYFADADDRLLPTLCEMAIAMADAHQLDLVFVFERPASEFGFDSDTIFKHPSVVERRRFLLNDSAALWQKVYSRHFLIRSGLRLDSVLRIAEDQHLHFRAMVLAESFGVVARELYFYRKHSGSLTQSAVASDKAFDIFVAHLSLRDFFENNHCLREYGDALFLQMLKQEFDLYCLVRRDALPVWREKFASLLSAHERAFLATGTMPFVQRLFFWSVAKSGTVIPESVRIIVRCGRLLKRKFCR